jgi:adenosylhomocysteine nucleosidase
MTLMKKRSRGLNVYTSQKNPRYAIIGAMDEEIQALVSLMELEDSFTLNTIQFFVGHLNKKPIVLMKSGIGLTMAAMSATVCFTQFNILGVINIGTAGGLSDSLNVLDVVVADKITYHDIDLTVFGVEKSFADQNRYVFKSDAHYLEQFDQLKLSSNVIKGALVSGHQFIHSSHQVETIQLHYPEAIAVEMEGASIAHVAQVFNLPFIVIRSISDLVHTPKNEMSFESYLKIASQRSAQTCFDFMGLL